MPNVYIYDIAYFIVVYTNLFIYLSYNHTEIINSEYFCAKRYTLSSSLYNLQNVSTIQFSFYVDLFLSLKITQLMSKLVISHITVIIDTIPIKLAICFSFFLSLKAGTCLEKRNSISTFRQTKF